MDTLRKPLSTDMKQNLIISLQRFCIEEDIRYLDNNIEKLCEVSQVLPNGDEMLTYPILSLHEDFIFILDVILPG